MDCLSPGTSVTTRTARWIPAPAEVRRKAAGRCRGEDIAQAKAHADQASTTPRLAARIAELTDGRKNLAAAMESRTTIDLAVGG